MTREEIREHAVTLILQHARDVEHLSISESLEDVLADADGATYEAACNQISDLISKATITVSFPEETNDHG